MLLSAILGHVFDNHISHALLKFSWSASTSLSIHQRNDINVYTVKMGDATVTMQKFSVDLCCDRFDRGSMTGKV